MSDTLGGRGIGPYTRELMEDDVKGYLSCHSFHTPYFYNKLCIKRGKVS